MPKPTPPTQPDATWTQTSLMPPPAVVGTLRIGVVPATSHAQIQHEIHDASTGQLLAMRSAHHFHPGDILEIVAEYSRGLAEDLSRIANPF